MVLDDIADLMEELCKHETRREVSRHFMRNRKWALMVEVGCSFRLDTDFIAGLDYYGYELKLVKKEKH
jgi:hypothetical protein